MESDAGTAEAVGGLPMQVDGANDLDMCDEDEISHNHTYTCTGTFYNLDIKTANMYLAKY